MRLLHSTEEKAARLEPTVDSTEESLTNPDVETAKAEIPTAKLIKQLGSPFPWVRRRARQALREREAAVGELIAAWDKSVARTRRNEQTVLGLGGAIGLTGALVIHFLDFIGRGAIIANTIVLDGMVVVLIMAGVLPAVSVMSLYGATVHRELSGILADINDIRVVGFAADGVKVLSSFWKFLTSNTQVEMKTFLQRMLPQMQADDGSLLNERQRRNLRNVLRRAENPKPTGFWECDSELVIAILKALTMIGDGATLPFAEALANMNPTTPEQERIREAAREAVTALREWAEREKNGQILLRGAPAPGSDELLHPVEEKPEASPEQLLRAANHEE